MRSIECNYTSYSQSRLNHGSKAFEILCEMRYYLFLGLINTKEFVS